MKITTSKVNFIDLIKRLKKTSKTNIVISAATQL